MADKDFDIIAHIHDNKLVVPIAQAVGRTRQAVSLWRKVPVEHVTVVERLTGLPRNLIRPDIYPVPPALRDLLVKARRCQEMLTEIVAALGSLDAHAAVNANGSLTRRTANGERRA